MRGNLARNKLGIKVRKSEVTQKKMAKVVSKQHFNKFRTLIREDTIQREGVTLFRSNNPFYSEGGDKIKPH